MAAVGSADLKVNVTANTKDAEAGLKNLDSAAGEAEGGIGKFGAAAAAGGAALVAFATKGVIAFEDIGTTVGKMSDATGLSAEAASRLIAVGGDVGVSSDTLQTSIGKMEKTLGKNAHAFDQYGVSVAYAKDGTVDANGTFINAIGTLNGIEDPAARAAAGAAIFGKGWQSMSELIGKGSAQLTSDLAAVDPSRVFNNKDVSQAKDLRESFDKVKDSVQGLLLTIGKALAPIITALADELGDTVKAAEPLVKVIGEGLAGALKLAMPIIKDITEVISGVASVVTTLTDAIGLSDDPTEHFTMQMMQWAKAADDAGISADAYRTMVTNAAGDVDKLRESLVANGVEFRLTTEQIINLGPHMRELSEMATAAGISQDGLTKIMEDAGGDYDKITAAITANSVQTKAQQAATDEAAASQKAAQQATEDAAQSVKAHTEQLKAEQVALTNDKKAQDALTDSFRIAADKTYALKDAHLKYDQTLENLNKTVQDANGNQEQIAKAYRDATSDAADLAQKTLDLAENNAELDGKTLSASQKLDIFNESMVDAASKATGPLHDAILGYIADTNGIPDSVVSEINADLDRGDIDAANKALADASKARTASIKSEADQDSLNTTGRKLDDLAHDRTVKYDATGGMVGGKHFATGTDNAPGGIAEVGEYGRELMYVPPHSQVIPHGKTESLLNGLGGNTYVTNNNITVHPSPGVTIDALFLTNRRNSRRGLDR